MNRPTTNEEKTQYAQRLHEIYSRNNPSKIQKIEGWINNNGSSLAQLHSLYIKCCKKYNIPPQNIFMSQSNNNNNNNQNNVFGNQQNNNNSFGNNMNSNSVFGSANNNNLWGSNKNASSGNAQNSSAFGNNTSAFANNNSN